MHSPRFSIGHRYLFFFIYSWFAVWEKQNAHCNSGSVLVVPVQQATTKHNDCSFSAPSLSTPPISLQPLLCLNTNQSASLIWRANVKLHFVKALRNIGKKRSGRSAGGWGWGGLVETPQWGSKALIFSFVLTGTGKGHAPLTKASNKRRRRGRRR